MDYKITETIYYAHTLDREFTSIALYGISDLHYGSPHCSIKHIDRMIADLQAPNAYAILNGDLIQADIRMSKGDIFSQVGTPQQQRKWIINRFLPVKDKILGCTRGNHELRICNQMGDDHCEDIADALGCPYDPDGILLKISFGHGNNRMDNAPYVYYAYATHGYGGARTTGAKAQKLKRLAANIHASVYFESHDHEELGCVDSYLMPDPRTRLDEKTGFSTGKVVEHNKKLIKTGSAQKWGGYAKRTGLPPTQLSTPVAILRGWGKPWVNIVI